MKIPLVYATRSDFKRQELATILAETVFRDEAGADVVIGSKFEITFSDAQTDEPLEADLSEMVRHKAVSAYRKILVPCIVEHAGLILEPHRAVNFPGGLTQPMMDALGPENFVRRLSASGERAIAQAVVGYCDGMSVEVFVGETEGVIVGDPRGSREFYWDTIFCPDEYPGLTYAEIAMDPGKGVSAKMKVSQSAKAFRKLVEHRSRRGANVLFANFGS